MTKKGQRTRAQRRHEMAVMVNHLTVCGFYPALISLPDSGRWVRAIVRRDDRAVFWAGAHGEAHQATTMVDESPREKWPDLHVLKFLARKAGVWQ